MFYQRLVLFLPLYLQLVCDYERLKSVFVPDVEIYVLKEV